MRLYTQCEKIIGHLREIKRWREIMRGRGDDGKDEEEGEGDGEAEGGETWVGRGWERAREKEKKRDQ